MTLSASPSPLRPRGARFSARLGAFASGAGALFILLTALKGVEDQLAQLPPPPPTRSERAQAGPEARAVWLRLLPRLEARLASDRPLELGAVWATRGFRICGFANAREEAVDDMTPFYSDAGALRLKRDGARRFFKIWPECLKDPYVRIREGEETEGSCGSPHFRATVLGRLICALAPEP
jgi:hypothetical protein